VAVDCGSHNEQLWNGRLWREAVVRGLGIPLFTNNPNKESRQNGGFYRAGALFRKGRLIPRYFVLVVSTSRPSFIS
jgi:hypothetical protein